MKSMTTLRIPTPLRTYTGGKSEVIVSGSNVGEALDDLTSQFPAITPHLFNEGGELRPFVNLFVGEDNIKDLQGVSTPIKDADRLMLIPSIAGGCHCEPRALNGEWAKQSPRIMRLLRHEEQERSSQ
jgi:molybdopterin synthase sulfur carrier subunit